MLNETEINNLLSGIHTGKITVFNPPVNLYEDTYKGINKQVEKGYGKTLSSLEVGSPDHELLSSFKKSIYPFSSAKVFQQTKDMSMLLFDESGFLRSFSAFKKDARKTYDIYNVTWLETEFNTANGQAQMGQIWNDIEKDKDILPFLRYVTVGDSLVRDEHAELDGVIKPVDDPFWSLFMPLNGFNCRCTVEQLEKGKVTPDSKIDVKEEDFPKMFRNNAAKTGEIFQTKGRDAHPYFSVEKRFEVLKKNNFNLPFPNDDY